MVPNDKQLIIINGKERTDSIASYHFREAKCDIVFNNSNQVYSYNRKNVKILEPLKTLNPNKLIIKANGTVITDIEQIFDYEDFIRVVCKNGRRVTYRKSDVEVARNCLFEANAHDLFEYFKEIATALSLRTDNGINILRNQYERIYAVEDTTVLAKYFMPHLSIPRRTIKQTLIYPFGLNQSQKTAVENAFSSQISIIQGPPGTGKTQTILNIIANAVRDGKTVAVVSNNNSATRNVAEKLEKYGLSFLTAFLGNQENKYRFLDGQSGYYPQMKNWELSQEDCVKLEQEIQKLSEELSKMLTRRNRIAQIEQELLAITPEQFYFNEYYQRKERMIKGISGLKGYSSEKLLSLWVEYENNAGRKIGLFKKIMFAIRFSRPALVLFRQVPEKTIPFLQDLYYKTKTNELYNEKSLLERQLNSYRFEAKMEELTKKSMTLFKAELALRYHGNERRPVFKYIDFRRNSDEFNREYPVVLSTTYSIKGTLSMNHVYDYLIVDEASQVDLATGVLAFSCAKNIVIVGDQKQLPNVLTPEDIKISDDIWARYKFDKRYNFSSHSMLVSAIEIWPSAPTILLKEHYRCHPKIAGFFNQKFYNNELIIMTEDHREENVLSMYRTMPGNHARGHMNQRQIDVIREEILPALNRQGFNDIGIITPYVDQVDALKCQLGRNYDVATVHKFQGREKEAIVLSSVDNEIGAFVDNPNLLNVAVSRAVKSLTVIISDSKQNERTNYGDLAKYIEYNNCQIIDSKVFSVFDMLYKGYYAERKRYLKKHKRVSEFDSENLAYCVIEKVLKHAGITQVDCTVHSSLATLVKDFSNLTVEERRYASNPMTHLDFLLFDKMNKSPILAIEVDGTNYHMPGSKQEERDIKKNSILNKCGIPLLRIRTNEIGVEEKILAALRNALEETGE